MKLDKNSYGTVALVFFFCILISFVLISAIGIWWIYLPLILFLMLVCGWQVHFHLVPERHHSGSDTLVGAVADGVVIYIDEAFENEWLKSKCRMISVYMDFWDYHANYWPVSGSVTYAKYHPGKHFLAFKPKASEENEHTCTCVRTPDGQDVFFKQLAGGFARRIVNYAEPGMEVSAGDQCGIIKFGSRIDFFLPLSAEILVKIGDKVVAQESLIARLK